MARKPVGINFEKIIQSIKDDVLGMVQEYQESALPITDDDTRLHHFCERLEFLLKFGLRERSGVLGSRKDLWGYLCRCLADRRNIHDGLKVVKANTELKTSDGRFRGFVRYCLVHQCLADVIQQCIENNLVTSQFYVQGSLVHHGVLARSLVSCLYHLCDLTFDLAPTGHDLDVSWPTFARVGGASPWRAPSRTMSLSSLCSYTSQVIDSPGSMAPVGEGGPVAPSSPTTPEAPTHESKDGPGCRGCQGLMVELEASKQECEGLMTLKRTLEDQVDLLEKRLADLVKQQQEEEERRRMEEEERKKMDEEKKIQDERGRTDGSEGKKGESEGAAERDIQRLLEECQQKLDIFEKENNELKDAEARTRENREQENASIQQQLDTLNDKYEERGNLLRIANDRVNQIEAVLKKSETATKEAEAKLVQANTQAAELKADYDQLSCKYEDLKKEMVVRQDELRERENSLTKANNHIQDLDNQVKSLQEQASSLEAQVGSLEGHVTRLQGQLETLEHESKVKGKEMEKIVAEVEEDKRKVEEELGMEKEETRKLGEVRAKSTQLNADNSQLRDKIMQLLKEKDILWKANYRLEDALSVRHQQDKQHWLDDTAAGNCMGCRAPFSLTRRRHHCRKCGQIFCQGCSDYWIMTAASRNKVRVCTECFDIQTQLAAIIGPPTPATNSSDDEETFAVISEHEVVHARSKVPEVKEDVEESKVEDEQVEGATGTSSTNDFLKLDV